MVPAPRKPTPVTIWAATRPGSCVVPRPATPYVPAMVYAAAPRVTRTWVRNPAAWRPSSRSSAQQAPQEHGQHQP